ncbi:uncharacterized protein BYT42DRAFT_127196 [Radiomyces spectabilis]|uniref:uncharacterized protein n=1 Tax=Radiomyces spectabilis TaxID=64574 RepID=UPI00221F25A9|nr:uncharacterized protein BYT42DRAFT_127196 [Radiomyces spectabilis]KAI8367460.1 hypothetical protein BYT42DRAFT_127196 [Radiomyces spectabilis]
MGYFDLTIRFTDDILHLGGNYQKYMLRVWEAFLRSFAKRNEVQQPRSAKRNDAVLHLLKHKEFNMDNWEGVPGEIEQIRQFYGYMLHEFNQSFGTTTTADAIEEVTGSTHISGLLRFSAWLLRRAILYEGRRWTLLPLASHQIGYVPIHGTGVYISYIKHGLPDIMYRTSSK